MYELNSQLDNSLIKYGAKSLSELFDIIVLLIGIWGGDLETKPILKLEYTANVSCRRDSHHYN